MKVKSHKTFSVSPDVARMFDAFRERGYGSMSDMLEAAVRRLCGEEKQPSIDIASLEGKIQDAVDRRFAAERGMLKMQIHDDIIVALQDRLNPSDDDDSEDFTPPAEASQGGGIQFETIKVNDHKPSWRP